MESEASRSFTVSGAFRSADDAARAAAALAAAGFAHAAVAARPEAAGTADAREARFMGRLVWIVVLWSIAGGIAGALIGIAVVWAGIGPSSTTAVVLQVVGWAIFGHLIAGIWAGYALLADRSQPEFAPPAGVGSGAAVEVRCSTRAEIERAREALLAAGAREVRVAAGLDVGAMTE
jgi:hypothetical protein